MPTHEHRPRIPSPTPSEPPPTRRVRSKRHPALRTRRGLAVGTVMATAGLAGVYWAGDLATTTTAATTGSTTTDSSSTGTASTPSVPTTDTSSSFDSSVDVAPSSSVPDTSSHAS